MKFVTSIFVWNTLEKEDSSQQSDFYFLRKIVLLSLQFSWFHCKAQLLKMFTQSLDWESNSPLPTLRSKSLSLLTWNFTWNLTDLTWFKRFDLEHCNTRYIHFNICVANSLHFWHGYNNEIFWVLNKIQL